MSSHPGSPYQLESCTALCTGSAGVHRVMNSRCRKFLAQQYRCCKQLDRTGNSRLNTLVSPARLSFFLTALPAPWLPCLRPACSYMVAAGLCWHEADPCPARTIVVFAKHIVQITNSLLNPVTGEPLQMRVGIHKGPVWGTLVGRLRRKYTLLGDTVDA